MNKIRVAKLLDINGMKKSVNICVEDNIEVYLCDEKLELNGVPSNLNFSSNDIKILKKYHLTMSEIYDDIMYSKRVFEESENIVKDGYEVRINGLIYIKRKVLEIKD